MRRLQLAFQAFTAFYTIHYRHHDITHHYVWHILHGLSYTFLSVYRFNHGILILQQHLHVVTYILIVVNDQHHFLVCRSVHFHVFNPLMQGFLSGIQHSPFLQVFQGFIFLYHLLHLSFLLHRKYNPETCAFSFLALYPHCPLMQLHKSLHQSQSQSGTCMLCIYLIKTFKHVMYMFFGHANTCIADFHTQAWLAIFLYPRKHHLYLSFFRSKFKGIGQ